MRVHTNVLHGLTWIGLLVAAAGSRAQTTAPGSPMPPINQAPVGRGRPTLPTFPDDMPTHGRTEEASRKARDEDRQKRLVSDTDKLLALATQLKQDVDRTDRHMLSLEVVKRSEEIEKLARSIKDRAKE